MKRGSTACNDAARTPKPGVAGSSPATPASKSKQPKEIRDIEKQLKVTTIAARDLHARAIELGLKDIEESERQPMNFSICALRN
jgi:hypothetical protein